MCNIILTDINGLSNGAVWPPSPRPTNRKYNGLSVFPPTIKLKAKHLIAQINVWNDTQQWYQKPQHLGSHVSGLVARSTDWLQHQWQTKFTENQWFEAVVGLPHNGKPISKRLFFWCLRLAFIQFLPLIWVETEILQGVPPLSWNQNFAMGSPTEISFFLRSTQFWGEPNQ